MRAESYCCILDIRHQLVHLMMDSDIDHDIDLLLLTHQFCKSKKLRKQKRRRFAINPYLKSRKAKGRFARDFEDLRNYAPAFMENFHMSVSEFDSIVIQIDPLLAPKGRARPDSYTTSEKLAMTLEFLASGSYQRHVASVYRASKQALGKIVYDTCSAIYTKLQPKYLKEPQKKEWLEIANRYNALWNFPNCVGALDGKHVSITCPANSSTAFYNYKGFFSIVLMAISDPDYKFSYVDVGAYGSEADSTIFRGSSFGKALFKSKLQLPPNARLNNEEIPFYFVADDAFPLHDNIMKPFCPSKGSILTREERIFNYRLSRARRCIENAFGILCARWRVLARTMQLSPTTAQIIVACCCVLHNYLMETSKPVYCPDGFADYYDEDELVEGEWRSNLPVTSMFQSNFHPSASGRGTDTAKQIRNQVKDYVNSEEGKVPWQDNIA